MTEPGLGEVGLAPPLIASFINPAGAKAWAGFGTNKKTGPITKAATTNHPNSPAIFVLFFLTSMNV